MNPKSLNLITALNCEAKSLIDYYRLVKVQAKPYDYYTGVGKSDSGDEEFAIHLIVCGIGAQNMSIACGWLAAKTDQHQAAWLNIGSAGHQDMDISEVVRVHRVIDIFSGNSHYPAMTAKWSGHSSTLITYESACSEYPQDALVDMEGAAFFSSAGLFASTELVQSIKIVSDNQEHGFERLNAALISQLIQPHAKAVDNFAKQMIALLPNATRFNDYLNMIAELHSTVSQRQQYTDLLSKLQSLHLLNDTLKQEINKADSMKQLLKFLTDQLKLAKPSLAEMVE